MLEALDAALECFATIFNDISWSRDKDKIIFDEDIIITVKDGEYLFDSEYFDETVNAGGNTISAAKELILFVAEARTEALAEHIIETLENDEKKIKKEKAKTSAKQSPAEKQDQYRKNNKKKQ